MKAYVLPFLLYLGSSQVAAAYPDQYGWLYPAAVVLVGTITIALLHGRRLIRPHWNVVAGLSIGVVGVALWIALCRLDLEQIVAGYLPSWLRPTRAAFNPFASIISPIGQWAFIAFRVIGLAMLVPVAEELFWRGFLLRWLTSPNWQERKLNQFSMRAFLMVTLLFAFAHPEWLAAAVYGGLLNALLYWKGDLWNCIFAHGVSNLILAAYIVFTGSWQLW